MTSTVNPRPRSRLAPRGRHLAGAFALGAAGTVAAAAKALRRWERSELAAEELRQPPDVEELRIRSADGAELAAFVARPSSSLNELPAYPSARSSTRSHQTGRSGGDVEANGEALDDKALFVLAHGWTNDRRVWAPVARRLVGSGHHVVCYDHRGHGRSTVGSAGLTLEALAEDMLAVLEHVDARDAVLAGHSMGGMTAQALATLYPERVRERVGAMVLVATACTSPRSNRVADLLGPRVIAHRHLDRAMTASAIGPFLVRRTVGREACRAHLDSLCEMFVSTPPHVRAGFLRTMSAMDLTEGLPKIDLPVTVVAGELDHLISRRQAHGIAGLVPGSRLVEIPHTGHMVPIEAPDKLSALLHEAAGRRRRARPRTTTQTKAQPQAQAQAQAQAQTKTQTKTEARRQTQPQMGPQTNPQTEERSAR